MAGYYALLGQQPRLGELIGAVQTGAQIKASREARAMQERAMRQRMAELEADKQAALLKEQQDAETKRAQSVANLQRFAANAVLSNPAALPQIAQLLQRHGAEMPQQLGDQAEVQIAGEQPIQARQAMEIDPQAAALELQGRASAVLGAPKPEEQRGPELDPIGKRIILESNLMPGTPEFKARYSELVANEDAAKGAEGKSKVGELATNLRKEFQDL
jgi:hypothetical protein